MGANANYRYAERWRSKKNVWVSTRKEHIFIGRNSLLWKDWKAIIWKDWKPILCRRTLSEDYLFFERAVAQWFELRADSSAWCVHLWEQEKIYP